LRKVSFLIKVISSLKSHNRQEAAPVREEVPKVSSFKGVLLEVIAHASNIKFEGEVNGVVTEAFGASSVDEDIVSLENFISIIQFDYFTTVRFVFGVTLPLKTILTVVK